MLKHLGRVAAAVMVSAALAASCGSDEPTTRATATTVPPLETTPPTSGAPTSTSAPTTTAAPPTTDSPEAVEQAVIDGYMAAWNAFNDAVKDPTNPAVREAVLSTHTGASLAGATTILDELARLGRRSMTNVELPAQTIVESVSAVEATTAYLVICEIDSNMVVETGSAPDGSDAVVNDDVRALRLRVRLERSDRGWKLRSGDTLGEWTGTHECGSQQ